MKCSTHRPGLSTIIKRVRTEEDLEDAKGAETNSPSELSLNIGVLSAVDANTKFATGTQISQLMEVVNSLSAKVTHPQVGT